MNGPQASGEQAFLKGVFGPKAEHAKPRRKKFRGWHRPRKQYVRSFQWCAEIGRLLDGRTRQDELLRYLTLPGPDLLDVRSLHGVCAKREIKLKVLGFNNELTAEIDPTELNISKNEVSNLSHIHNGSRVLPDDVRKIATADSLGFAVAQEFGPFDVINLDLCNSFAADQPGTLDSYYSALQEIAQIQVKETTHPWLLFLTTFTGGGISQDALGRFMRCITQNIERSASFREELRAKLELDSQSIDKFCSDMGGSDYVRFFRAFGLGIGKWLLGLMLSARPKWTVRMLQSYSYRVKKSRIPNMLSFAYKFTPDIEPPHDSAGLAHSSGLQAPQPSLSEEELGSKLVAGVERIVDLDVLMTNSPSVHQRMATQTADLLESARYSRDDYLAWAGKWTNRGRRARR